MNPLSPIVKGAEIAETVTVTAVRLAFSVPKLAAQLLGYREESNGDQPSFRPTAVTPTRSTPAAPGGTGRRPTGPGATPGRARAQDAAVEATGAPPEPTSAAGASGGVGGTTAAPGDAAAAEAPDPTAASAAQPTPIAPRRERRQADVEPTPAPPRKQSEPSRAEIDRRRQRARQEEADAEEGDDAVLSFGSTGEPGANLRVDAPWDGYDDMKAGDIVRRVQGEDLSVKAVVRLYEQTHKKRKSVLQATDA
jgi:hypothetical protein